MILLIATYTLYFTFLNEGQYSHLGNKEGREIPTFFVSSI